MPARAALGQMAQWFGRWGMLCMLALGVLRADVRSEPTRLQVAYIGTRSAQTDRSFQRLRAALDKLPKAHRSQLNLAYQPVRDQGPAAAQADLAHRPAPAPDIWVAPTGDSARAVHSLADHRPIVFATYPDPRRLGLVSSLSKPGGRATGVMLEFDLHAKRLELLRDASPGARVVGALLDSSWAATRDLHATLIDPARSLGLELRPFVANSLDEVDRLMLGSAITQVQAWYIPPTYIADLAQDAVIAHLKRLQRPAMHATVGEVQQGALMAYSLDNSDVYDTMATQIAKLAAGHAPGDLPVQRSMRYVLSVRPRSGPGDIAIHPSVIRRADRVF